MEKILTKDIFLSFYGDDFTGSTDVMEALALNGIPTALFLAPPTPEEVAGFQLKNTLDGGQDKGIKAFGVAGVSRSMAPDQMDMELPRIFEQISKVRTDFFHYKTCSTFDSSPQIGSIGHATDLAFEFFPSNHIPLLVGAPTLNRFTAFGNLFARAGSITYRLDRHPTMSKHPVTPMLESDLREHLAKQTYRPVTLFDIFALETDEEKRFALYRGLHQQNGEFILFDVLNEKHLLHAGQLICEFRNSETQLLVGSSGMEYAICSYLLKKGTINKPEHIPIPGKSENIIVITGSASPMTQKQVSWAISQGFLGIRMETEKMLLPEGRAEEKKRVEQAALQALENKQNVVIYSALGPDDPAIERTKQLMAEKGVKGTTSELFAQAQGEVLKVLLHKTNIRRAVVAGGDTSGYAAKALGIYALETLKPMAPGAPLCVAHSTDPYFDGLEIALKGGQNGNARFFESILKGELLEEAT